MANPGLIATDDEGREPETGRREFVDSKGVRKRYDLSERTARFGEAVIDYANTIPVTPVTRNMITQLVNAATSVGANYQEADDGVSRKDFRNRIGFCKKEAKETKFWLRMIAKAVEDKRTDARPLWQEANELALIFVTIFRNSAQDRSERT